ncbi:MAG: acetaldehyde dehydrogenase, partial [Planctomycetota bacterium]
MDRDLASIQNARDLLRRSRAAGKVLAEWDQATADAVVDAMARAATDAAVDLAELAVQETGMGRVESKTAKNLFCSHHLHEAYRNTRTCGVLRDDRARGVIEIGAPVGIV